MRSNPYSAIALHSQVSGRALKMERSISEFPSLNGALNSYGMEIGSLSIVRSSRIKVNIIGGLSMI